MTLVAELARVARRTRGSHRLARNGAVTVAAEKVRGSMRGRRAESGDVLPSEGLSTDERDMAGGARGIGRCQVRGANTVTIQAALDHRRAHRHSWLAGQCVTHRARQRLALGLRRMA